MTDWQQETRSLSLLTDAGPKRFAKLRNLYPGVSEKVLADQLRQLEIDGVLCRRASPSIPPKVTCSFSASGEKLVPMMEDLCAWGGRHFGIQPTLRRS